jgi:ubiquinone/menaquinone biosynthesis C-methylase UbiE
MADSKVKEQYDRLAASYDERWRAYVSGTLGFLRGRLRLSGGERVLDVACGTGELERMLISVHPGLNITGVDISENMLSVAREKLAAHESVGFRRGGAEELPFPSGTFDVVVTANSFHYFDNPTVALLEMRRVLRPGGRAVVLDWCRDFLACRACDLALKALDPAYKQCYDQRELRSMMRAAGLRVEDERRIRTRIVWGMMVATGVSPR